MFVVQVFVCLIIIAILIKIIDQIKNRKLYRALEKFPSIPTLPLIGNAHLMFGSVDDMLENLEKIHQPFKRLVYWMGPVPLICLKKHDDIAVVFSQNHDRELFTVFDPWIGKGLVNAKYEEWKKSRKMLSPAFNSEMLSKYLQVFNRNASDFVERLKSVADIDKETDITEWISYMNLSSITENSIGIQIQNVGKSGEEFYIAILESMKELIKRFQWPFLLLHYVHIIYLRITGKIEMIYKLQQLPAKLIKDKLHNARKIQNSSNTDSSKTMLDLLINKGLNEFNFTETRIRDELLQIIVTGTETSTVNLSFLMLMLAMNQDIQQKVNEEIAQITSNDLTINEDHLINHTTYLEQCIRETLRMFSPSFLTTRRTHKDIILKDNAIIPANTNVLAFIHLVNYDPELYANPHKWDPEHFNEEAVNARPKTSQLNFGYGPRSCIGYKYAMMSIKTQMIYILRNYHLSTNIKQFTSKDLKADLSIRSKIGFPIKFTTRQKAKLTEEK